MFIVYTDGHETIITTKKREKSMIKEYFSESIGRKLEDFDRDEIEVDAIMVTANVLLDY